MTGFILVGRSGSGKDTATDYLIENYGFTKTALGESIYGVAYNFFGMEEKDIALLQNIGQGFRSVDPDIWINDTWDRIINSTNDRFIISDCRQQNEMDFFANQGFVVIKLNRDKNKRIASLKIRDGNKFNRERLEYETEKSIDDLLLPYATYTIENNYSLKELYAELDMAMNFYSISKTDKKDDEAMSDLPKDMFKQMENTNFIKQIHDRELLNTIKQMYHHYKVLGGKDSLFITELGNLIGYKEEIHEVISAPYTSTCSPNCYPHGGVVSMGSLSANTEWTNNKK